MKSISVFTFLIVIFISSFQSFAQEAFVSNQAIVMLHSGEKIEKLMTQLNQQQFQGAIHINRPLSVRYNIWLIEYLSSSDATLEFIQQIKSQPMVAHAQPNHEVKLRATPNDANFTTQWSLNNTGQSGGTVDADIDAVEAWDITTGGSTVQNDQIVVAVIDGGFQLNHPDLQANFFVNTNEIAGNGIDDDLNGYIDDINGWDAYQNDGVLPSDQHGTHVSGIIGAKGNNATGVAGVNWNVKILPIAGSSGNEATVVAAYAYAAAMREMYNTTNGAKGAFVVATNSSFGVDYGNPANFPIWCAFYDTLGAVGVLSAGAGPNLNIDVDVQGDIPSTCPSLFMIGVTNTTRTDTRNTGAGFGDTHIDIGAPGTQVNNTVTGSGYSSLTGTSMATPHVAGVIGLMYAGACDQLITDYKQNPSAVALAMRNFLLTGVDSIASMQTTTSSKGRLNAFKALQKVQTYVCTVNVPPSAGFNASNISGCPGINVQFSNNTLGQVDSIQWIFQGGVPSVSSANNPTVNYPTLGNYDVILIAYNSFGSDTLLMSGYISVNNASVTSFYQETFESGDFTTSGWSVENIDNTNTWEVVSVAGNTPGNKSARVNIFNNQTASPTVDALISPSINMSYYTNVELSFEHAHRRRVNTVRDSLWVSVSSDGGNTWASLLRVAENGTGTFATNSILNSSFTPSSSSDWCFVDATPGCFNINLNAYSGESDVKIKFEVQNNSGNNVYIDNIQLSGVCANIPSSPPVADLIATTDECQNNSISFTNLSTDANIFNWTFEGGTPLTSTSQNPVISYNATGTFDVTLIATGPMGSDTLYIDNYVTIYPAPSAPIVTQVGSTYSSSYPTGNQWYDANGPIIGETGQTFTPTQGGVYYVVYVDDIGCTSISESFISDVSVEEHLLINFSLYPNPAEQLLLLQTDEIIHEVRILDAAGRIILLDENLSDGITSINISSLAPGSYLLTCKSGVRWGNKTFIKL
jgi:PKD repeat protein